MVVDGQGLPFQDVFMNSEQDTGLRNNISFITLGVRDLARSRRFYADMGLAEHQSSNEHVAFFDMGGQLFALFPRDALAEDAGASSGEDPEHGRVLFSLSQNVRTRTEIDELLERARKAGGRVLREPSEPPWGGVRAYFADPDGFAWEIAWNPRTLIDDAGHVQLDTTR
jgi:catechol 2,3-dioxygenase-like lactoylglutathione lyase family enzyme